ncbi:MAG: transglycosylase SLT domain-containing protein [Marinagarivorans sp.]|nr:transglycosylase SLT domain-containing protein [Marinagarivorans sp.]
MSTTQLHAKEPDSKTVPPTLAAPSATDYAKLQKQRMTYQAAKKAIDAKKYDLARKKLVELGDYPLKAYIEYQLLKTKGNNFPLEDLDQFIAAYPNSLLTDRLVGGTLTRLAAEKKWPEFNRYYTSGFSSTAMQCRHLMARHYTQDAKALDDAIALWTVGQSQPTECEPLFTLLENSQKITPTVRWQRFDAAIKNRELSLATFLMRKMDKQQSAYASLYLEVAKNPKLVTQPKKFVGKANELQTIIAYGISKVAQNDPKLAWQHWETYEAQRLFAAEIATPAKKEVIKYLTRKGYLAEADQLLSYSHSLREASLIEELARENLEQLNWSAVLANIALLPEADQQNERWLYWAARSHQELKTVGANPQAVYQELAQKRSWYGFLAADHLKLDYKLQDSSVPANPEVKFNVSRKGPMARARELWLIGEKSLARMEWYYGLKTFNTEQVIAAGELARDWGWYNSGIVAMITGNLWDHLSLRFPLAYNDAIAQAAVNTQLDKALIFAIARQESAFAEDAQSQAGARGLMQLMPATAKQQAAHSGVKNHTTADLFKPEHNIQLGSKYLGGLLTQFKGNRILAAAAYNAGPGRVKQWLGTPAKEKPADVWVETIPFKETRQYVQNVLTYSVIYTYRMDDKTDIHGNLLRDNERNISR